MSDSASSYWPLGLVCVIALILMASDALAGQSSFWESHQLLASFATEGVVALGVIFGLDRLLAARARRQWRPLGVRIANELNAVGDLADTLEAQAFSYCERVYGDDQLPEGSSYETVLLEALVDGETWMGSSDFEIPPLIEIVHEEKDELEKRFTKWAPILIVEPNLASIAACVTELITANSHIVLALEAFHPRPESKRTDAKVQAFMAALLLQSLEVHEREKFELQKLVTLYTTGQPLEILDPVEAA